MRTLAEHASCMVDHCRALIGVKTPAEHESDATSHVDFRNPDFAQFVLSKPIGNPWDLHLLDSLEQWYGRAYMIYPPPLANVIHPAQSSRGSDRLHLYFGDDDEAVTDYILLLLDKGWGLWNRVRTIVWAAMLANLHRLGLSALWQVSKTCDPKVEHVFPYFATEARNIYGGARWHLPFLKSTMAKVQL